MKSSDWRKTFINAITISRILVTGCVFILTENYLLIIATYAAVSDFLDGFLARKFNLNSKLGEQLDQMADKIFHLVFFYYLIRVGEISGYFVALFWLREISIIIFRYRNVISRSSNFLGKFKTFLTYVLIIFLLMKRVFFPDAAGFYYINLGLQVIILIMSYYSLVLSFKKKN